jgi:hypothetical protein
VVHSTANTPIYILIEWMLSRTTDIIRIQKGWNLQMYVSFLPALLNNTESTTKVANCWMANYTTIMVHLFLYLNAVNRGCCQQFSLQSVEWLDNNCKGCRQLGPWPISTTESLAFVYVAQGLTFRNSSFCSHRVFVFCKNHRTNSDYFPI